MEYLSTTPYATPLGFKEYLQGNLDGIPEDLVCGARLTHEPALLRLADELEELDGAWYPDDDVFERMHEIRDTLRSVLNER